MNTQCKTKIGQALYGEYIAKKGDSITNPESIWDNDDMLHERLAWEAVAEKCPSVLAEHFVDEHISGAKAKMWLKFGLSVAAGIGAALGYLSVNGCTSVDLSPGNAVIEGESGKLEVTQDRLSWSQKAPQVLIVENVKPVK